jgi:hypothetical protein
LQVTPKLRRPLPGLSKFACRTITMRKRDLIDCIHERF